MIEDNVFQPDFFFPMSRVLIFFVTFVVARCFLLFGTVCMLLLSLCRDCCPCVGNPCHEFGFLVMFVLALGNVCRFRVYVCTACMHVEGLLVAWVVVAAVLAVFDLVPPCVVHTVVGVQTLSTTR